jgi:hypothetical protein
MGAARLLLKEVLPSLRLRKFLDNEFPFIFSVMVRWIHIIFGTCIQMYHEEMQVKFEYGCCPIIIGEVIALGLRKHFENDSFRSFFQ